MFAENTVTFLWIKHFGSINLSVSWASLQFEIVQPLNMINYTFYPWPKQKQEIHLDSVWDTECGGSLSIPITTTLNQITGLYFLFCFILTKGKNIFKKFIDFRERQEKRERNIHLLFHLFVHSLFDSCVCPDWGSNPQCWFIRTTLPTELPSQRNGENLSKNFRRVALFLIGF